MIEPNWDHLCVVWDTLENQFKVKVDLVRKGPHLREKFLRSVEKEIIYAWSHYYWKVGFNPGTYFYYCIIAERMKKVPDADYFTSSEESQILYDSILIRLQAIGENIKKIEKITPGFTENVLGVDAAKIIRFRDILSHHYELLDYQVIHNISTVHIPILHVAIKNFQLRNW